MAVAKRLLEALEAGKAELRAMGVTGIGVRSAGLQPSSAAYHPIRQLVVEFAEGRSEEAAEADLLHHVAVEIGDAKLKRDASYLPSMWSAKRVVASLAREPGQPLGLVRRASDVTAAPAYASPYRLLRKDPA
jgi:hypothetical protein